MSPRVTVREAPQRVVWTLEQAGIEPLLARLFAARGVRDAADIDAKPAALLPPATMKGIAAAASALADAIAQRQRVLVVADYDCDGATACAVALRGLRLLGAAPENLAYLVPDRFRFGYGLTPELAGVAAAHAHFGRPDWLVTVDNGIASVEGVAEAQRLGMHVLVTDHHLAGESLPAADVIVNPNQPGCAFPSKALAGVGVMFYVLLATRAELRRRGAFADAEPNLSTLLDLVALGTVADVVPLDANNRRLVSLGLARMRAGAAQPGVAALFRVAGRDPARAGSMDLGFTVGPRLNAAGRMADMSLGIEALLTDDPARALNIAQALDHTNIERRAVEAGMRVDADLQMGDIEAGERASLCLFDPAWHQGVIGILAGRLKEVHHRPTLVFAPAGDGMLKGSGRSIPGLHLRDALDLLSKRDPGLMSRFGGHAMAAGVSIAEDRFEAFRDGFEAVCRASLSAEDLSRTLETDGPLEIAHCSIDSARRLQQAVWGQGFAPPLFLDEFIVLDQRVLKEKHLKLRLEKAGARFEAIWFNHATTLPRQARIAYALDLNEWQGEERVQLLVRHAE